MEIFQFLVPTNINTKKNQRYYQQVRREVENFTRVRVSVPKLSKSELWGSGIYSFFSPCSPRRLNKWIKDKEFDDFIPQSSAKHGMTRREIFSHTYNISKNLILAISANHMVNSDGKVLMELIRQIQERFPSIFVDFIPIMKKIKEAVPGRNRSFIEMKHLSEYNNVGHLLEFASSLIENAEKQKIQSEYTVIVDESFKRISSDVLFHEIFQYLGIVDLLPLVHVSKRFNVNIWDYSFKDRRSKCERDHFMLLQNGKIAGDVLLARLIYYHAVDPDYFAKYTFPYLFSISHLKFTFQYLAERVTNLHDVEYPMRKIKIPGFDEDQEKIWKFSDVFNNPQEFVNLAKTSEFVGYTLVNLLKFRKYKIKSSNSGLNQNEIAVLITIDNSLCCELLKRLDQLCDKREKCDHNLFLEGLKLITEMLEYSEDKGFLDIALLAISQRM